MLLGSGLKVHIVAITFLVRPGNVGASFIHGPLLRPGTLRVCVCALVVCAGVCWVGAFIDVEVSSFHYCRLGARLPSVP